MLRVSIIASREQIARYLAAAFGSGAQVSWYGKGALARRLAALLERLRS